MASPSKPWLYFGANRALLQLPVILWLLEIFTVMSLTSSASFVSSVFRQPPVIFSWEIWSIAVPFPRRPSLSFFHSKFSTPMTFLLSEETTNSTQSARPAGSSTKSQNLATPAAFTTTFCSLPMMQYSGTSTFPESTVPAETTQ